MSDSTDKLIDAVRAEDVDASLKLLQDAGGSCQARDLAQAAHEQSGRNPFILGVNYSVVQDNKNNIETLYVGLGSVRHDVQVAGLVQEICRR